MSVSIGELAVRFGCELRGDPDTRVERVATLANADQHSLAFLANPRYRSQLAATRAAAVVLGARDATGSPAALLLCANPYATYARIAALLLAHGGAILLQLLLLGLHRLSLCLERTFARGELGPHGLHHRLALRRLDGEPLEIDDPDFRLGRRGGHGRECTARGQHPHPHSALDRKIH